MHLGFRHVFLRRKGMISSPLRGKNLIRGIDALAYVASFSSLFFTLDQVRLIWIVGDTSGVSILSWTFYTISSAVWSAYGYLHKARVLLITQFIWAILSILIVVGIAFG